MIVGAPLAAPRCAALDMVTSGRSKQRPYVILMIFINTLNISKMIESIINRKWECDDDMRHDRSEHINIIDTRENANLDCEEK